MPKYTDEQIERAKNIDVVSFLMEKEKYTFVQSGKYLKCLHPNTTGQPSSLSIDTEMNRIFYNSVTGSRPLSAIDWCMKICNMDFQSSMRLILKEEPNGTRAEKPIYQPFQPKKKIINADKIFQLPEKSDTNKHVYAYLTKSRGISGHIVERCLNENLIIEDNRKNAVFLGYDENNTVKYGTRRGTITFDGIEPFKRDCIGSDKNYAFKLVGKNTDTIYVSEAAIDALSLASLEDKFHGKGAYLEKTYISTGGAGVDNALEQFCKTHNVKTINVCFDNDEAGKNGMEKIMQKYREMGYTVNDMRASLAHDYNDELTAFNKDKNFYPEPPIITKTDFGETNERIDNMPEIEISTKETQHNNVPTESQENINTAPLEEPILPEPQMYDNTTPPEEPIPLEPSMYDNTAPPEEPIPPEPSMYSNTAPPEEPIPPEPSMYDNTAPPEEPVPSEPQRHYDTDSPRTNVSPIHNTETNAAAFPKNEQHKESDSVIFGNISYSKIPEKEYIPNIDPSLSLKLFKRMQEENIAFSGKISDEGMIVVVSRENSGKVKEIVKEETERLSVNENALNSEPSKQEIEEQPAKPPTINQQHKTEQSKEQTVPKIISDEELQQMQPEEKMNFFLASMKDVQEKRRSKVIDKIDRIDNKIERHENRIARLNAKVADFEASLKTLYAFKRVFGNTVIGTLLENSIEKKQAKIVKIKEVKIPKREEKIRKQNVKKSKANIKLGKVNRKINKIEKIQDFFNALGSKDREERHQGFVNGLENLSDIHKENLEIKAKKVSRKISNLTAEYNSPNISHRERLEIGNKIKKLRVKSVKISEKINSMDSLYRDLDDMKNGKFSNDDIERAVNKTADKISERLESSDKSDNQSIVDRVIDTSVESGSEAISEVAAEKVTEKGKTNPKLDRERIPEDREPEVRQSTEQQIISAVAVVTGIDVSELNRLPAEIKADIISEFQENNGNIPTEKLAERLCDIADITPSEKTNQPESEISMSENKDKQNPLGKLEENVIHYNDTTTNLSSEKKIDKDVSKDKPLFSRSKIKSNDFMPTSDKSREDMQNSKSKNMGIEL